MNVQEYGFETFDHGADIGIRGYGKSIEEAFSRGAMALFSYMYPHYCLDKSGKKVVEIEIFLEEDDLVSLFIKWINTLIAESEINHLAFIHYELKIEKFKLTAIVKGVSLPPTFEGVEVKGATYCEARVEQKNGMWIAQCVIDV